MLPRVCRLPCPTMCYTSPIVILVDLLITINKRDNADRWSGTQPRCLFHIIPYKWIGQPADSITSAETKRKMKRRDKRWAEREGRKEREGGERKRERAHRERERERERENSNSNSKTLFSKDCSLGSFRPV